MDKPKKYLKGFADIEQLFEHLDSKEKQDKRAEWLKNHSNPSKDGKEPDDTKNVT